MTDSTEDQAQAFYAGFNAAKARQPASVNPYTGSALFDPQQLAEHWFQGHKYHREQRSKRLRRPSTLSAHYAF